MNIPGTEICRVKFGSQLYGTVTSSSDLDLKSVFIPCTHDILLGKVPSSTHSKTKTNTLAKNTASDTDQEAYSLQNFLQLCSEGQLPALDLLFAPEWALTQPALPLWNHIQENKINLLSRSVTPFLGYCYKQASKYGVKGSRIAAVRLARDYLATKHSHLKIRELPENELQDLYFNPFINFTAIHNPAQNRTDSALEVCGRKFLYTITVKEALTTLTRMFDQYGERARLAETNEGIDWKALSHAVRVGRQALELLATAHITFPRPEASHLIAIKTGQLPYKEVATEIENLLEQVTAAQETSVLPARANTSWINQLVLETHRKEVLNSCYQTLT